MSARPVELSLTPEGRLLIGWSDGSRRLYRPSELRDQCPCATCREKRSDEAPPPLLPVLSIAEAQPTRIISMKPVGQYAYNITFSDGHDTGIYTFEFLQGLGEPQ